MVNADSALQGVGDIDYACNQVAVGKGAAYDLFLLRHAELIRASTSATAIEQPMAVPRERQSGARSA